LSPAVVYPREVAWDFDGGQQRSRKITALCREWEFHQPGFEIGSEGTGVGAVGWLGLGMEVRPECQD
jgi:hypothetical protein